MAKSGKQNTLSGTLKPVYALVGKDPFLQLEALRTIAALLPANAQRSDFDGETAQLAAVLDEARSFSMFGGDKKLVVVRSADDFISKYREQLENYASEPSPSATLVLRVDTLAGNQRIHKLIAKTGEVITCEPPKLAELSGWVTSRATETHGVKFSTDAARLLVDLIGDDMGKLDNEIAKLALQVDGDIIKPDDVAGNVAFQREQEMYELTGALAGGDSIAALKRWRQLLETDPSSEFRAVTWLVMWLEDVRHVIESKRINQRPDFRKLWRYKGPQYDRFMDNCTQLGDAGYRRAVDLLADVDRNSKSGVGTAATNVEQFILSLSGRSTVQHREIRS